MRAPFSLQQRNFYPWLFLGLVLGANAVAWQMIGSSARPEIYLSVTGGVAALVHFFYAQHSQNTTRFLTLFREFNQRYDDLNGQLNLLTSRDRSLVIGPAETQTLYDYFNLCAEEYLYFKVGFIDAEVWQAWLRGMKAFAQHPEVRRIWEEELKAGSYYGFNLDLVDRS